MENKATATAKFPMVVSFAAFIIVIAGVMYGVSIITQVLMALFISIICAQPIFWLQKKKLPQGMAIAIVFIVIIAMFIGFSELIGKSLSSFSENEALYEKNLNEMGNSVVHFFNEKGITVSFDNTGGMLAPAKIMSFTAGLLGQLGGLMGNVFTIFFLTLFLLLELDGISIKIKAILKDSVISLSYLSVIGKSIRHYLSIKTFTSLLTGALIWISLAIVGVDYAIIWGLIAFLLNYIPNIGSILAAVPALLFAIIQLGYGGFIWTGIIFISANVLIGNVVEPKMMGKGMGLSTFVVFLSLIFWGFILGTVGMFLSIPLTMSIKIMLEQSPKTKWIAIALGTDDEAQSILENQEKAS